jgi:hypothetical protein
MRKAPERLVFIDETSVKTNMTRARGRARRGQRLQAHAPAGLWNTQTFIAGLTEDALIAPWVIKGAMDRSAFDTFVETQLVPVLAPGTIVILDNLATHKSPRAAQALKDKGCWFLFLPAYSPDPCVAKSSPLDCFPDAPHPSKWHSPNSRPTSAASVPDPSTSC